MLDIMQQKTRKWTNVLDLGIDNTGTCDVGKKLNEIIGESMEYSVLYFPKGIYLFETEVKIGIEITLQGDSNMGTDSPDLATGNTQFITRVKDKDFTMIKLTDKKQCIKNINFYSDSCKTKINHEPPACGKPGYHYEIIPKTDKSISAIKAVNSNKKNMLGHYEDINIKGFSGTGIYIPYYSIADNLTVSDCGVGIATQADVIISNSRVTYCGDGMRIETGTSLNNVKVKKIQRVGIIGGNGGYRLCNITIDECGHCGFKFESLINFYISGIIKRCGQYFYNTDYDTFLKLLDEMDITERSIYEDVYYMLYGKTLNGGHIDLTVDSQYDWNPEAENEQHQVYIMKVNYNTNVIMRCNENNLNKIITSNGESLMLYNNRNNYKFKNGEIEEINGFKLAGDLGSGLLGISYGNVDDNNSLDRAFMKSDNGKKVFFYPGFGMVMASTDPDIEKIQKTYGMRWILLNSEVIGRETVYYFKILYPGQ